MNKKEHQWFNGMTAETTQGHFAKSTEKAKLPRNNYTPPVKMRFEWEGKIYEGTAFYVGDAKEQEP